MEVRNCRTCGRLFNHLGGVPICEACKAELEKKFNEVREYIRSNPRATMAEICDANEVSSNQLKQWIREERLQFSKDSPIGIECELCGATIRTGRFCDKCKDNTANAFSKSIARPTIQEPPKSKSTGNKMRFI